MPITIRKYGITQKRALNMNIDTLKAIIIEGQELLPQIELVPRSFDFEPNARYVFVGVRQAGKSYLLYRRALQMIEQGEDSRRMLFVNFDDERLIGIKASELDLILQAYSSMFDLKPILFFDEIQNIDGWEHFARRLANQKYMVYITGSNAKMLSREIATTLGARYMQQRIFPYSFNEFLTANNIKIDKNWQYGNQKSLIERALNTYFMWGGFPESLLYINKRKWLNELYEKIILGDILQRNGIKNENAMRLTVNRLAGNIKTPTSYNRLANMVKATGISTTASSTMDYVKMCREACLIFSLNNYASKFVERQTIKKHYFVDNGLLHIFLNNSETSLLENLCAITLVRDYIDEEEKKVFFYNKEVEIDFYLPEKKKAIQAAYSLSDSATEEREVRALVKFNQLYGLDSAEIVTYSEEREIITPSLTIQVVPLYKWLLRQESNNEVDSDT